MLNLLLPPKLLPIGQTVPDFALLDQYGHPVSLSSFSDKRGVVLLFFASDWLKGDMAMLQSYIAAHSAFEQKGLQVLALSSINWETLFHLAKRLDVPFPLLFDQCCRQATFYKAAWVPKFITGRAVCALDASQRLLFAKGTATPEQVLDAFSG